MKCFVITLFDNKKSVEMARRCIQRGIFFDTNIKMFEAINSSHAYDILKKNGLKADTFFCDQPGIRQDPNAAMGCLASHYLLWRKCTKQRDNFLVMEHDSYLIAPIPHIENFNIVHCGKEKRKVYRQSYLTKNGLSCHPPGFHFKGTYGYMLSPHYARYLVEKMKILNLFSVDTMLSSRNFDGLQWYRPPFIETDDLGFSTISL